jgi:hypothetical protein
MARKESYSSEEAMESTMDAVKLVAGIALLAFAFIGIFLSAPFRRD